MQVYTDGACSKNPGPGGWGYLILTTPPIRGSGGEPKTTNNRMELTAVIKALEKLKEMKVDNKIKIYSDSKYVIQGATQWMAGWKRNGWRTASKSSLVLNQDLWMTLDGLLLNSGGNKVEFEYVRGHAGDPCNEEADRLARLGMQPFL